MASRVKFSDAPFRVSLSALFEVRLSLSLSCVLFSALAEVAKHCCFNVTMQTFYLYKEEQSTKITSQNFHRCTTGKAKLILLPLLILFVLFLVWVVMQIGQFFGEVDPVLMINLVNTSLYSFNKTYDYQSVCDPEKDSKAAAGPRSVYVVRYSLI